MQAEAAPNMHDALARTSISPFLAAGPSAPAPHFACQAPCSFISPRNLWHFRGPSEAELTKLTPVFAVDPQRTL